MVKSSIIIDLKYYVISGNNEDIISYVLSVDPLSTIIISLTFIVWFKTEFIALFNNSHLLYVGITIDMSMTFWIFDINKFFVFRVFYQNILNYRLYDEIFVYQL